MTELSDDVLNKMIKIAQEAQENAYAPYSNHPVGAAILSEDDMIFGGSNMETAHYKGICAEGTAISSMASAGKRKIQAVVITSPGEHICTPCGDCLQRLREFSNSETKVYTATKSGTVERVFDFDELLPYSFGPENIDMDNIHKCK